MSMRPWIKKPRKPRGIKKNGMRSRDMCSCGSLDCDPFTVNHNCRNRTSKGLCMACDKKPENCSCKSSSVRILYIKKEKR